MRFQGDAVSFALFSCADFFRGRARGHRIAVGKAEDPFWDPVSAGRAPTPTPCSASLGPAQGRRNRASLLSYGLEETAMTTMVGSVTSFGLPNPANSTPICRKQLWMCAA